jgi:pimeloyl-ACP methyl ester carboxylesterase
MEKASLDGITLEYEVSGSGEPVIMIHGALVADTFRPLVTEPSLQHFRLISYRRRGYAGSSSSRSPISMEEQANDCVTLLRHLNAGRAHIVGHSYGGCIALQLALDSPSLVQSLTLLEPALIAGESGEAYRESLVRTTQAHTDRPAEQVVDEFAQARWGGPGYRAVLDSMIPGAFEQAVADAATLFEHEIPGLLSWHFGEAEARRIDRPVLAVLGAESEALSPRFPETYRLLLRWLKDARGFLLDGATHWLTLQNPRGLAEEMAKFFAGHPISAPE